MVWRRWRWRRDLGSPADRATFETLHTASPASPPLRGGLTPDGARRSIKHLRALLGTAAVGLADGSRLLAWDGVGEHHGAAVAHVAHTLESGRTQVLGPESMQCERYDYPIRYAVIAPITSDDVVVGALAAYGSDASAGLVRATNEVARWVTTQVELAELAELDRERTRAMEAEVRALWAQISPHFVYNSLTAIASFVRTDPERARELLLEFADLTRYSFLTHGEFTTLAEELRSIDRYLLLERTRFGDRLDVTLRIAPEVLPVAVPFLGLQPLVENAVRHGLEGKESPVAVVNVTVVTVAIGALGLRFSRTTSDFYVASRMVSPRWNASAIGGEYLSAASFLGIAGLVLAYGVDMLWFPVGYTPGTSSSSSWLPRRYVAPARTRCLSSLRHGSSRRWCATSHRSSSS